MTPASMTTTSRTALRGDLLDFTDDPGFAAPAGVQAMVTLHAYGYCIYVKNNIKF